MASYVFHRLEWVPFATFLLLLLVSWRWSSTTTTNEAITQQHDHDAYSQVFAEANGVYSVQKLVAEQCMTDARGLCAASLRRGDARCQNGIDPAFVSLLDEFTDLSHCRMTLGTLDTPSSWPPSSHHREEALELLMRHTLHEANQFSKLYFQVISSYQGPTKSAAVVDHEGIAKFVIILLTSLWQFLAPSERENKNEALLTIVVQVEGTAQEQSVVLDHEWTREQLLLETTLQHVVDHYYKNEQEDFDLVPSFVHSSLHNNNNNSSNPFIEQYSGFFLENVYPEVQAFLENPPTANKRMDLFSAAKPSSQPVIVENDLLSQCLWQYYDANNLLTDSCPTAMKEGSLRLKDLAYERRQQHDDEDDDKVTSYLEDSYGWISLVFVVAVVYEMYRLSRKSPLQASQTTYVRRLRQYIMVHIGLSLALWIYSHRGSGFWNGCMASLLGLLWSYYVMIRVKDDYVHVQQGEASDQTPYQAVFELPLLKETTSADSSSNEP